MLEVANAEKSVDGNTILDSVTVTAKCGEVTVVIGPNGAGKSTLLRCLALIDPPDAGTVTIGESTFSFPRPENGANAKPPWPELTVVFQGLHLWPHLTLRDNILLPVKKRGISARDEKFKEYVEAFDLSHVLDRYVNQASGGERQRASLVRALLLQPKYMLLDEPTSAADVEHVRRLVGQLRRLKEDGITIVVVTHLLGFAKQVADQIVFMEGGKVLTTGGVDILDRPNAERLAQFVAVF